MIQMSRAALPCTLIVSLFSLGPHALAQDATPPPLPPAKRYVDSERADRAGFFAALSTAKLGPSFDARLELDPEDDTLRVRIEARVAKPGDLCFAIPAWRPGSYRLQRYGRTVRELTAKSRSGRKHAVERVTRGDEEDANSWLLRKVKSGKLVLTYEFEARRFQIGRRRRRPRGRTAEDESKQVKETTACYQFHGPSVWLYEMRHKQLPWKVEIRTPKGFDVATGLAPAKGSEGGRVSATKWRFTAPDYDVLADCPTRLGPFESFGFLAGGKPFEVSIYGAERDKSDRQEFAGRVQLISQHFIDMFGGAPFDRYVYLFTVPGGGGLEHLNSTTIGLMSLRGSEPGSPVVWDTVISHEFFHLWNVKRLRPMALGPFDYTGPNRTTALWLCEGVTSYYAALALARTGLWSAKDYWKHIGNKLSSLRRNPVRREVSVADSSWTVWGGAYPIDRRRIDYYLKGECLGFLLDAEIRLATKNEKSLDDVMRALYEQCKERGEGFAEDDIRLTSSRIAGTDLDDFFDRYVYGTADLPVETLLPRIGLVVETEGEGRRFRFRLDEAEDADALARSIRRGLVDVWK